MWKSHKQLWEYESKAVCFFPHSFNLSFCTRSNWTIFPSFSFISIFISISCRYAYAPFSVSNRRNSEQLEKKKKKEWTTEAQVINKEWLHFTKASCMFLENEWNHTHTHTHSERKFVRSCIYCAICVQWKNGNNSPCYFYRCSNKMPNIFFN